MAYIDLATIKDRLGVTGTDNDTKIQAMIDSAIDFVENYTGRNFSGTPIAVTDEEYDLQIPQIRKDHSTIHLKNIDIVDVTSVKLGFNDEVVLDSSAYRWNEAGRLVLEGKIISRWVQSYDDLQDIKVSYTYAYMDKRTGAVTTPAAVDEVIAGAVANMYAGRSNNAQSERIGDYQISHGATSAGSSRKSNGGFGGGAIYTPDLMAMLEAYKWHRV